MNNYKFKSTILAILIAGAFAAGRYSVAKPEVVTKNVTQASVKTDENKDIHKVVVTKTVTQPSGVKETDTTVTTDTTVHDTQDTQETSKTMTDIIPAKTGTLNISALGAYSNGSLTYGASVTKQIIGPLTAGVFGLTNGTIGVSIGMSF